MVQTSQSKRRGASALTYGLLVGLIAVVALSAISSIGDSVDKLMSTTSDSMATAVAGAGGESVSSPAEPTATPGFTFTSHTFTSCGVGAGPTGPDLSTCQSSYSPSDGNWDDDSAAFNVSGGIQLFTIPQTGTYRIEVAGARGGLGTLAGGDGARLSGEFNLTQGTVLQILVGQTGVDDTSGSNSGICEGGGGGGSFVALADDTPLIVGGGGGGGSLSSGGRDAVFTEDAEVISGGAPGTGGNGGSRGTFSAAGGGFLSDGENSTHPGVTDGGGHAFVNGGAGGLSTEQTPNINGGFGGGGAGHGHCAIGGGGGGGYSGGAGPADNQGGGGGASFNAGNNPTNIGQNAGAGFVTVTLL